MAFVDRAGGVDVGGNLPNLKIEIENDVEIAMETDEECSNISDKVDNKSLADETEEGELVDCNDEGLEDPVFDEARPLSRPKFPLTAPGRPLMRLIEEDVFTGGPVPIEKRYENRAGGFVTGVNIFSPEEQAKLSKRAQRFGIDPSESKPLTQKLLKSLYKSMGITEGDSNIRFDTLHMRGTEVMNSQDVFGYFKDYAPASIEWLTSSSCNVMWLDDISAARALLGLSTKIKHLPGQERLRIRSSKHDVDGGGDTLMEQDKNGSEEDCDRNSEDSCGDSVSVSELVVPVPPGFWRKGAFHPNSECLLLRFATRQDRRTAPPGRLNGPELSSAPGYMGLISESRKRRFQESLRGIVFYDTGDEVFDKSLPDNSANPWASIAHSWGAFDRNKNKIRQESPPKRPTPPSSPVLMTRHHHHHFSSQGPPGLIRRDNLFDIRRRRPSNGERGSQSDNNLEDDDDDDYVKRRKVPRMRMHADDEAILVEKRLAHSRPKRHKTSSREHRSDLRKKLYERDMILIKRERSESSGEEDEEDEEEEEEVPDLRVAIIADPPRSRSPSPEDIKENILKVGEVKSVLRGARTHDIDSDDDKRARSSSIRKHQSRSRERHRRSGRRRKEDGSRRRDHSKERKGRKEREEEEEAVEQEELEVEEEEYDSDEVAVQPNASDLRAKIGKKQRNKSKERNKSPYRAKSPLQIEIDNDEYYRLIESD